MCFSVQNQVSWILVLFVNNFLIRMTEKSRQIRHMIQCGHRRMCQTAQRGRRQARQTPQRGNRPESMFRKKLRFVDTIVLFDNNFLTSMTEKSQPIRQMPQRGRRVGS